MPDRADTEVVLKLIAALALVLALAAGTFAFAGGNDGNAKNDKGAKSAQRGEDAREGQGPPSWAPAHGWRCKEAGNQRGRPAFKDCIKASKE